MKLFENNPIQKSFEFQQFSIFIFSRYFLTLPSSLFRSWSSFFYSIEQTARPGTHSYAQTFKHTFPFAPSKLGHSR